MRVVEVQITIQAAFPVTPLYQRLRREGRLLDETAWELCTLFDVNFQPDRMDVRELERQFVSLARDLYPGVDVWLNVPEYPKEACGTSGMKAAINGALNLSVLDGWWIEGHIEGVTGWSIGPPPTETSTDVNH